MNVSRLEWNTAEVKDRVNLPDHLFVSYCFDRYGLNREIYNTIDEWFYRYGLKDISERREFMIVFLASVQAGRAQHSQLQFGKGGLTRRLEEFMKKYRLM